MRWVWLPRLVVAPQGPPIHEAALALQLDRPCAPAPVSGVSLWGRAGWRWIGISTRRATHETMGWPASWPRLESPRSHACGDPSGDGKRADPVRQNDHVKTSVPQGFRRLILSPRAPPPLAAL